MFPFITSVNPANRYGLTLLELLVVLTILIALGGIVVASLPGLLNRTQTATAAANVPGIDAAIKRGLIVNQGKVGDRFDSLITGSGGLNGDVATYVGGRDVFETGTLTDNDLNALEQLGITELVPANESATNATFGSHDQVAVPLSSEAKVCAISSDIAPDLMEQLWNLTPNTESRYLVFGLGERSTLVGGGPSAMFAEAPVHFSDDSLSNPKNMYSRYLIVIELTSTSDRNSKARYVGTAIPHRSGLQGVEDQLEEFYSSQ